MNLNITDAPAPNTISKYFPNTRKTPTAKLEKENKKLKAEVKYLKNKLSKFEQDMDKNIVNPSLFC